MPAIQLTVSSTDRTILPIVCRGAFAKRAVDQLIIRNVDPLSISPVHSCLAPAGRTVVAIKMASTRTQRAVNLRRRRAITSNGLNRSAYQDAHNGTTSRQRNDSLADYMPYPTNAR
jgi:hypothetical protein